MLLRPLCIVALLLHLAACGAKEPPAPALLSEAQVQELIRGYVAAFNAGDATTMMSLVAKDPVVISASQGEVLRGWEAIRQNVDESVTASPGAKIALATLTVQALGADAAVAVAPFALGYPEGRQQDQAMGALTLVVRRGPAGLEIVHEHLSIKTP